MEAGLLQTVDPRAKSPPNFPADTVRSCAVLDVSFFPRVSSDVDISDTRVQDFVQHKAWLQHREEV